MIGHHNGAKQHRPDGGGNTREGGRLSGFIIGSKVVSREIFLGVHVEPCQPSRRTGDKKEYEKQGEVETTDHHAMKAPVMDEEGGRHTAVYDIRKAVHLEAEGALGFGPSGYPTIHQITRASKKNGDPCRVGTVGRPHHR